MKLHSDQISGQYKVGLDKTREAVISAHFMDEINKKNFSPYSSDEFAKKSIEINDHILFKKVMPILLEASENFIQERVTSAKVRAIKNYGLYDLRNANEVGLSHFITEVMFDRQFMKGSKLNCSRLTLCKQISKLIAEDKPIKMAIPALPYKTTSPLKSRGTLPELAEVNFLLALMEVAKTVDLLIRQEKTHTQDTASKFLVICDGKRFNSFLNEPEEMIDQYQKHLNWWIQKLNIARYVEIIDYQDIISQLPSELRAEKKRIEQQEYQRYTNIMEPLLDPYAMNKTLCEGIKNDPDPESCHFEGRFIPLFKSLIYIVRYKSLTMYAKLHDKDYTGLYAELTKHLYEPYIQLTHADVVTISKYIRRLDVETPPSQEQIYEFLRVSMLQEAWHATIMYLAEIKSDRNLTHEPITHCLPDYIRWTIHAKSGQLGMLTTTATGDPVQPWHGAGVFKLSKKNKIKLYTLPILSLEGSGAIPIMMSGRTETRDAPLDEFTRQKQPLFYIYPDIHFKNFDDFLCRITVNLTRTRKS